MLDAVQRLLNDTMHIVCHTDFSSEAGQKLIAALEAAKEPAEIVYPTLSAAYHDFRGQRTAISGVKGLLKRASAADLKTRIPGFAGFTDEQLANLESQNPDIVPAVVFIDLCFHAPGDIPQVVAESLKMFPAAVFVLYANKDHYSRQRSEFPPEWIQRLEHYYKLFDTDELEHSARQMLKLVRPLAVARKKERLARNISVFISYSRTDKEFAEGLVNRLRGDGYDVWFDTQELVGGSDWMDSIQTALDKSQRLVLIISPEALESQYVKMEYRYFINDKKALIPVVARTVPKLPPELSLYQFVDFSAADFEAAYSKLVNALAGEAS